MVGEEIGIGFVGIGFDPVHSIPETPIMPKERYRLMRNYMPTVGKRGLDMMFRTCTIQVHNSTATVVEPPKGLVDICKNEGLSPEKF